jgi:hypothetical protein
MCIFFLEGHVPIFHVLGLKLFLCSGAVAVSLDLRSRGFKRESQMGARLDCDFGHGSWTGKYGQPYMELSGGILLNEVLGIDSLKRKVDGHGCLVR